MGLVKKKDFSEKGMGYPKVKLEEQTRSQNIEYTHEIYQKEKNNNNKGKKLNCIV